MGNMCRLLWVAKRHKPRRGKTTLSLMPWIRCTPACAEGRAFTKFSQAQAATHLLASANAGDDARRPTMKAAGRTPS